MAAPRAKKAPPDKAPALAALIRQHGVPLLDEAPSAPDAPAAPAAPARGAAAVRKLTRWVRLDTDIPQQEQGNWCWAATSLGVHRFYERTDTTSQCEAVNLILPATDACSDPQSPAVDKPWFLDDALADLGNLREPIIGAALSFAELRAEIDRGTPLATRIGWAGGGGHFMVLEGYRNGPTKMVTVHDPIYGQSDMSYDAYSASYQGSGRWTHSYRTRTHRLRVLDTRTVPGGTVTAVSRKAHLLDLFMVDVDGRVVTAASDAQLSQGAWRGWWPVRGGLARPGARVACVARAAGQLDIFVVGTDGGIYTAAWDAAQADGAWRGWWRIGSLQADTGAQITAVSRHADKLDVFIVDVQGRVMTAAWQRGDAQWRGWRQVQGGVAPPGAPVGAVARSAERLDIFVTGADGAIRTAAWDAALARGAWRGWWPVLAGRAAPGAPVTAVARDANKLDLFVVGTDRRIHTAAWDAAVAGGAWRGWWPVAGGTAEHGTWVACCARTADHLDLAVVGLDGGIHTAAWEPGVAHGVWRGWWRIGDTTSQPGSETALLRRTPGSLDAFNVGTDGVVQTQAWDAALAGGHWRG